MKARSEKLILTDADGVLLDWSYSFGEYMRKEHGMEPVRTDRYSLSDCYDIEPIIAQMHVKNFNASYKIRNIPPLFDAIKYVKKLHEEHGYIFHCITAISNDPDAQALRKQNLERLFGPTAFDDVICVGTGADKTEALMPYKDSGCLWIEDKLENAELGQSLGLDAVLMEQDHTRDYSGTIRKVKSWKEIHAYATGELF